MVLFFSMMLVIRIPFFCILAIQISSLFLSHTLAKIGGLI